MADKEVVDAIYEAALVLLHREIRRHGQVTLTGEDFLLAEAAQLRGQAIQLNVGPDQSVIFTHAKSDKERNDA